MFMPIQYLPYPTQITHDYESYTYQIWIDDPDPQIYAS